MLDFTLIELPSVGFSRISDNCFGYLSTKARISDSFRIVVSDSLHGGFDFFWTFPAGSQFFERKAGKDRKSSGKKLSFSLEKGVVDFCQLSENAETYYPTKYVGYRIPLSDFLRGRISDHKFSDGSSSDIRLWVAWENLQGPKG